MRHAKQRTAHSGRRRPARSKNNNGRLLGSKDWQDRKIITKLTHWRLCPGHWPLFRNRIREGLPTTRKVASPSQYKRRLSDGAGVKWRAPVQGMAFKLEKTTSLGIHQILSTLPNFLRTIHEHVR